MPTSPNLTALRDAVGARSWSHLARILGVGRMSVYRWRTGKAPVPGPVLAMIRHLVKEE